MVQPFNACLFVSSFFEVIIGQIVLNKSFVPFSFGDVKTIKLNLNNKKKNNFQELLEVERAENSKNNNNRTSTNAIMSTSHQLHSSKKNS